MKRSTAFALLSITLLSLYVRLLPVTQYLYWGADFGEYFGITQHLALGLPIPEPYPGWGVTYTEFPGLHLLVAALSWTGLNLEAVAVLAVPILAALTVIPVFLLLRDLTGRDWPGLVAGVLVAVALPHVYTTSHPVPGALGHLLLATGLLLLWRLRGERRLLALLLPVSLGLLVVHHLSSYFLILAAATTIFLRVLLRAEAPSRLRAELSFLAFFIGATLLYWGLFTENFREFLGFERLPWWGTALLILLIPLALVVLAFLRRRLAWRYTPRFPRPSRGDLVVVVAIPLGLAVILLLQFTATPGTSIAIPPALILFLAPTVILLLTGLGGRKYFDFLPGGGLITGTFLAIILSWILGATLAPTFLIPYRHLEYLAIPLALFAGLALVSFARHPPPRRWVVTALVAVLVGLAAVASLPPREALGNHFEGTRAEAMSAVLWSEGFLGVTATDHRVSSGLFGFVGVRATWDTAPLSLHAPTFPEAQGEMRRITDLPGGPARVDFILVDLDLVDGATLLPWDPAIPLSPEAQAKFQETPYQKLFDDGYSQLYWVNWGLA